MNAIDLATPAILGAVMAIVSFLVAHRSARSLAESKAARIEARKATKVAVEAVTEGLASAARNITLGKVILYGGVEDRTKPEKANS